MRKWLKMLLLAGVFTVLLCGSALAAGESGICDVGGAGLTPLNANDAPVSMATPLPEGVKTNFYPDAVQVRLSESTTSGTEYLVFVLEGSNTLAPTVDNIVYIDQQTGNGSALTFDLYPSRLVSGKTYYIYVTTSNGTAGSSRGNFSYYAAYKLGDVDNDGEVTIIDVRAALQMSAYLGTWTDTQKLAADVDQDKEVTIIDVRDILLKSAGLPAKFI